MAQQLSVVVYGVNSNAIASGQYPYQTLGLPTQGVLIRPADSGTSFNGVTMVSCVQLLPQGLNQPSVSYFSAQSVSSLITAANA